LRGLFGSEIGAMMKKFFTLFCLMGLAHTAPVSDALAQRPAGQASPERIAQRGNRPGQRIPNNQRNRGENLQPRGRDETQLLRGAENQRRLQQQIIQAIGITPNQRLQMEDIRRDYDDEIIAAGRNVREARRNLDQAIMSEHYDEELINQRADELAAAEAARIKLQARLRGRMRSVLSADQIRRFNQMERRLRRQRREQRQMGMMEKNPMPFGQADFEDVDLISLLLSMP